MIRRIYHHYLSRFNRGFPLERTDTLQLPVDFEGLIVTSDIDKTYLQTPFASLGDMVKVALESAEDKKSFQGMVPLYQGFRSIPQRNSPKTPLYFVSASPPPMRNVLMEKMALDGIETDGITLKKWFRLIRHGRFDQLRRHVVYKLNALLINRSVRPLTAKVHEVLIGDDSETDADAYLLYADILHGQISPSQLESRLRKLDATQRELEHILQLAKRKDNTKVARIYIHCTTRQDPSRLPSASPALFLGALDSLQIAIDAYQHQWVSAETVEQVSSEFTKTQQLESLADLVTRGVLSEAQSEQIQSLLH